MLSHGNNAVNEEGAVEDDGKTVSISLKLNEHVEVIILDRTNSNGVRSASIYKYFVKKKEDTKPSDLEEGSGGGGRRKEVDENDDDNDDIKDDNKDDKNDDTYDGDDEFSDQTKIDELIDEIRLQAIKVITICLIFVIITIVTGYNIIHYVWKAHIKY